MNINDMRARSDILQAIRKERNLTEQEKEELYKISVVLLENALMENIDVFKRLADR